MRSDICFRLCTRPYPPSRPIFQSLSYPTSPSSSSWPPSHSLSISPRQHSFSLYPVVPFTRFPHVWSLAILYCFDIADYQKTLSRLEKQQSQLQQVSWVVSVWWLFSAQWGSTYSSPVVERDSGCIRVITRPHHLLSCLVVSRHPIPYRMIHLSVVDTPSMFAFYALRKLDVESVIVEEWRIREMEKVYILCREWWILRLHSGATFVDFVGMWVVIRTGKCIWELRTCISFEYASICPQSGHFSVTFTHQNQSSWPKYFER